MSPDTPRLHASTISSDQIEIMAGIDNPLVLACQCQSQSDSLCSRSSEQNVEEGVGPATVTMDLDAPEALQGGTETSATCEAYPTPVYYLN